MDIEALIAQAKSDYSVDDVTNNNVETVSVLGVDDLALMVRKAVARETATLREQLAAGEADGLEAEAAAAALEAEAVALEAKADAEQRVAQVESELKQAGYEIEELKAQLANAGSGGGEEAAAALEAAKAEAKEAKDEADRLAQELADAEMKLAEASDDSAAVEAVRAELEAAKEEHARRVKELEEQLTQAKEAAVETEPVEPVTDADLRHAQRLAEAFLEDVFMDDEERSNKAIADGKAEQVFEKELGEAYRKYVKRVKAGVRAEGTVWNDCLADALKKTW